MGSGASTHLPELQKASGEDLKQLYTELSEEAKANVKKALEATSKKAKILIVTTSASKMGDHETGAWSEEITGPYYTFVDKGFEVTVCSIAGGDIPIDAGSLSDQFKTENDKRMIEQGSTALKAIEEDVRHGPGSFRRVLLRWGPWHLRGLPNRRGGGLHHQGSRRRQSRRCSVPRPHVLGEGQGCRRRASGERQEGVRLYGC
ncbi:HSP31 [Symbiodinium necroappetens]|uniref:HSP31 protein n=1 Tax=Symbiodinium necroappetens TaxID=1628268 RepID=A0A812PSU5_9DINO|nr:HSP31 [Symbiodinium necroappetens]